MTTRKNLKRQFNKVVEEELSSEEDEEEFIEDEEEHSEAEDGSDDEHVAEEDDDSEKPEVDLYEVLGVSNTASDAEIKKAYYKLAKQFHPDMAKEADKEEATKKFTEISKAYEVLKDSKRRQIYDSTGSIADIHSGSDLAELLKHYLSTFKRVAAEDIKNVETEYRHSEEEKQDLLKCYNKFKGNMDTIIENMMCSTDKDRKRFRTQIQEWINQKKVQKYPAFEKVETKQSKAERKQNDRKEAEEASTLLKAMQEKMRNRTNQVALRLEQKYGKGNDISEEDFQAARKRLRK